MAVGHLGRLGVSVTSLVVPVTCPVLAPVQIQLQLTAALTVQVTSQRRNLVFWIVVQVNAVLFIARAS